MIRRHPQLAIALACGLALAAGTSHASGPDPDRVWVKFKPGAKAQVERALQGAGARFHYAFDSLGAFAVSVPAQALEGIRRNPNVEYVEADAPRHPMAQVRPYGIDMVQAPAAWDSGVTGGVKVCVIDSGIRQAHEDLAGLSLNGTASNGQSWNTDTCGHGSHVAGTIAARANDAGVVGVATGEIPLHIVKVFDGEACGWSYSSTLVNAAQACQAAGARVINMSLGGGRASTTERNAFQTLYSQGVLSIAAAGNDGTTRSSYPASYDSVVSVAAIDSNKALAGFSQRNSQVELAAPGVGVLSTVPQVDATLSVAGSGYIASALEGSIQATVSGGLVNGGRCTGSGGGSWAGKVVLCERGDISFADKVANAAAGGAAGAIVYNNVAGGFSGTLGSTSTIPAVSLSQADGQALVTGSVGQSASLSTVPNLQGNGYAYYDGTSMATPHVAGVAALVWSANPTWTNAQIRQALADTAEDLGDAGRDNSFGFGLVRAADALALLKGNGGGGGGGGSATPAVDSITLTTSKKGPNSSTRADVLIVDGQTNNGLGGVSVAGCFSGAVTACATGTTSASGQVSFTSGSYRTGPVSFCVTSLNGSSVQACSP